MADQVPRLLPPELATGVAELDDTHDALFKRLVALKAFCLEANHLPQAQADALLAALEGHHALEERLAEEMGMAFADHARQHRRMLAGVRKTLAEAVAGRANIFSLIRYLEYWFERHIAQEDGVFARHPRALDRDGKHGLPFPPGPQMAGKGPAPGGDSIRMQGRP